MNSTINKLTAILSMTDKISKPLRKISSNFSNFKNTATSSAVGVAKSVATATASVGALYATALPARRFEQAFGEVQTLGVAKSEIEDLSKTALAMSQAYGISATQFVRSSYDIQSAISDIEVGDLSRVTKASQVLALATKSDVSTITKYMGIMNGIFDKQSKSMGRAVFLETLAGKTAKAVQMFATDGIQMSSAFTSLGATAQKAGVSLDEQIAILGRLQDSMGSGAEAGTAFARTIEDMVKASKVLKLDFFDDAGKMLPIVKILEKIRAKFGDTLEKNELELLSKAFGKISLKAIKGLIGKTDKLKDNIKDISSINNMDITFDMASNISDNFDKSFGKIQVLVLKIGKSILSKLNPVLVFMNKQLDRFISFTDKYPAIIDALALMSVALVGVVTGLASLVAVAKIIALVKSAIIFLKTFAIVAKASALATKIFTASLAFLKIGLGGVLVMLKAVFLATLTGLKSIFVFLFTNPIGWIILAVGGVLYLVYQLIKNWKSVTKVMGGVWDRIKGIWQRVKKLGSSIKGFFAKIDIFSYFKTAYTAVRDVFYKIANAIKSSVSSVIDFVSEKLLQIGEKLKTFFSSVLNQAKEYKKLQESNSLEDVGDWYKKHWAPIRRYIYSSSSNSYINTIMPQMDNQRDSQSTVGVKLKLNNGGIMKQIANNSNSSSTVNYGGITVNTRDGFSLRDLEESLI